MNSPCFEPACDCCNAWSELNDQLRDQLDNQLDPDEHRRVMALRLAANTSSGSVGTYLMNAERIEKYLRTGKR